MNEISFSKYFEYVLKENGFINLTEQTFTNDLFVDLTATKGNQTFYFEFKIFKKKRIGRNSIEQVANFSRRIDFGKLILVTNARLSNEVIENNNVIIIDRDRLDQLTKNSSILTELIG